MSYSDTLRPNSRYQNRWKGLRPEEVSPEKPKQSYGTKETYCELCKVVISVAWLNTHLNSRTHRLLESLKVDR